MSDRSGRISFRVRRVLRETLLTGAALAGVMCLLAAIAAIGLDVRPLIFRSGSMEPAISTGSLALARTVPATELSPGDVVSVTNAGGTRITHRIVSMDASGPIPALILRGDANSVVDAETYPVTEADRVFFSVPGLGYVLGWLSHPYAIFAGGVLLGALATLAFSSSGRGQMESPRRSDGAAGRTPPPRPRDNRPAVDNARGTAWLVTIPVTMLTLNLLGSSAVDTQARFTDAGTAATGTFTTIPYFTCDGAIRANAPRTYYKLNETGSTTTASDSSGQGRTGTYQGGVTKNIASPCTRDGGTAVTFNGSSGYITYSGSAALTVGDTHSIAAWFRTTTRNGGLIAGWAGQRTGTAGTADRIIYMTNAGQLRFGVNNSAKNTIFSSNAYNDNAWHHVLATSGPSGLRLYVDGVQVASSTTQATQSHSGFFRVGHANLTGWPSAPTNGFFSGSVDEVAAFGDELTATDAQEHYLAGI